MKTTIFFAFYLLIFSRCLGQTDTTYLNADWKPCNKLEAKYYRYIVKDGRFFVVNDMYLNHKPQMVAYTKNSTEPFYKVGSCIYYNEDGSISSKGEYYQNKQAGTWTHYHNNGKDSSVIFYHEDGHGEYIRFSRFLLEEQKYSEDTYIFAEEMPSFPGGPDALDEFIYRVLRIPVSDIVMETKGKFLLNLVIDEQGNVTLMEIKNSLSDTMDEEAKRLVTQMPKWNPGKIDNKPVKVLFSLPIVIR